MSTVAVSEIFNSAGTKLLLPSAGSVIQVVTARTDARASYASGARVTPLDIDITPTSANNIILVEWMINGHVDNGSAINVLVNGNPYTSDFPLAGFSLNGLPGYGSVQYGYTTPNYDGSNNSVLQNAVVLFPLRVENTNKLNLGIQFFGPAFYLNRTETGTTVDAFESAVSTAVAYEIVGN